MRDEKSTASSAAFAFLGDVALRSKTCERQVRSDLTPLVKELIDVAISEQPPIQSSLTARPQGVLANGSRTVLGEDVVPSRMIPFTGMIECACTPAAIGVEDKVLMNGCDGSVLSSAVRITSGGSRLTNLCIMPTIGLCASSCTPALSGVVPSQHVGIIREVCSRIFPVRPSTCARARGCVLVP
jgi:hypothetical protein